MKNQWVRFDDVTCLLESSKAFKYDFGDGIEEWIPKSQMQLDECESTGRGEVGSIVVTAWVARDKGLSGGVPL